MTKIQTLKAALKKLPASNKQGVVASNSEIKYDKNNNLYKIFTGALRPHYEGSFEDVKAYIENLQ